MFTTKLYPLAIIMILLCFSLFIEGQTTYAQTTDPNREVEIYEASLSAEYTHPDRPIIFTWDTNADEVLISYRFGRSAPSPCFPCSGKGSVNLHGASGRSVWFLATVNPGTPQERSKSLDILIECDPDAWFFTGGHTPPTVCPSTASPRQGPMEIQQFENGIMFRHVNTSDDVYVLANGSVLENGTRSAGGYTPVRTNWEAGMPEDSRPDLVPPPGLYKPTGHFGSVWDQTTAWIRTSTEVNIRETLGWAIAPPVSYMGYVQGYNSDGYGFGASRTYVSAPNSMVLGLSMDRNAATWWQFESTYSLSNDNVPSNPSGVPCPVSGVWPAGCIPSGSPSVPVPTPPNPGRLPCPASGVWPAGCDPNLPPATNTPAPPVNGVPCPTSGVWPAGCIPNSGSAPIRPPSGKECLIPERGPWPPCATAGDPPPANTADDCIIPSSGAWPACARGGY